MIIENADLQIDQVTKRCRIVDNSDYSAIGSSVVITGTGTISLQGYGAIATGVTIDISGGDTESAWINLPVDSNGNVLNGNYDLVYTPTFELVNFAIDQFTSGPSVIWITQNVEDVFDEPGATNSVTVASATTPGNNGVKTVVAAVWNGLETEIEVSQSLTAEAGGSATLSFSVTYSSFTDNTYVYTGCDEVTIDVNVTYDCDTGQYGQIIFADDTVLPTGQTLVSRLWSIAYPTNLTNPATPSNISSSAASVVVNQLATGQWTYLLTYNVSVVQNDGLIVTYSVNTGSVPVNVSCAGTFCELICGIKKVFTSYAESVKCGVPNPQYAEAAALIPGYYTIAVESKNCGDFATYTTYVGLIRDLIGNCDCGCTDCGDTTETNRWINNAADIISSPAFNAAIFAGVIPYSSGSGPGPVTTTLPVAGLVNIPISSDYFQFTTEMDVLGITVGKKFVDVEFFCYQETGNSTANVTIEGQSILADNVNTDEAGTFRARIGTKKSGTDTVFTVQRLFTVNDFNAGTIGPSSAYYEFTNLITQGGTMELSITPGGVAANNLVFMFPTIEPKQTP